MMLMRAAVLLATLAASLPARAASPLDDLIPPAAGKAACFKRVYDKAHLAGHPRQNTTAMVVRIEYVKLNADQPALGLDLGLSLSQRGGAEPLFAQGSCEWHEAANRDVQDRPIIKTFKRDAGADCTMLARPDVFDVSSAEEGGYLILDRGSDRDTLMVYLNDSLTMVKSADRAKQIDVQFGNDDRVFLLRRTADKDCDFVNRVLSRQR